MLEAFTYPFFQRALLAGLLVSVACGVIGSWVLVKRIASISGGLAHAAFGGVGLGYLFGFPPLWGAAGFALLSGAGIGVAYARRLSGLDTLIAMVWAVGMALGIVFISWTPGYAPDLMSYLFGSILVVPWSFLVVAAAVDVIVVVGTVIFFREFQAVTFDEEHARTLGVPVERMLAVLLVLTALTVVVLMRVVGAILVIALLTVPAAVARQWTHSLGTMMAAASLIGAICTTGGLMLAYLLSAGFGVDTPTGPLIVLLAAVFYGLSSAAVRLASRRGGADPAIAPNGVSG